MENQDSQPAQDSPEGAPPNQPPLSAKPRTQIKVRAADATPTFERIADKDTDSAVTHIRPVKPAGSGINLLGLILPIGVTLAIAAAGYFGFLHVKEQNARILAAEIAATDAEAALELRRRSLADMSAAIRDTKLRIPAEQEKAKREAAHKASSEFSGELATLARTIAATNSDGRNAARKAEDDMRRRLTDLKGRADELRKKTDELESKNRELKAWLNAHTLTMHPKF